MLICDINYACYTYFHFTHNYNATQNNCIGFLHILSFIPYFIVSYNLLVLLICHVSKWKHRYFYTNDTNASMEQEKNYLKKYYLFVLISRTKYTYLPIIKNMTADLYEHKASYNTCAYKFKYQLSLNLYSTFSKWAVADTVHNKY